VEAIASRVRERAGGVLAFALSVYALYWVIGIVDPQVYRVSFLLIALAATFLLFPGVQQAAVQRAAVSSTVCASCWRSRRSRWPIIDFDAFVLRAATPTTLDVILGAITTLLVLDATRRTTGWILPATAALFLVYALFGNVLDQIDCP
jgi:TRAP-type uncharacterized transport system fused permease subunit